MLRTDLSTLQQDLVPAFEFFQQADLQNLFYRFQFSNFRNTFFRVEQVNRWGFWIVQSEAEAHIIFVGL